MTLLHATYVQAEDDPLAFHLIVCFEADGLDLGSRAARDTARIIASRFPTRALVLLKQRPDGEIPDQLREPFPEALREHLVRLAARHVQEPHVGGRLA